MLVGKQKYNRYKWLNPIDEALICSFLQGAVYVWCNAKEKESEEFAARDFVGNINRYWNGTPLEVLYNHYHTLHPEKGITYAKKQAGKVLGYLLKQVIVNDKRTYTTSLAEQVRHYQWDHLQINDETPSEPEWLRRIRIFINSGGN